MICPNCGAQNLEGSLFCANCGRSLQEVAEPQQKRALGVCLLLAVVGLFLFVAILAVGAFFLRDRLLRAWQGFVAQPTKVAMLPTSLPSATLLIPATSTPLLPSPSPTIALPTPTLLPTPTPKPTPVQRTFRLIYRQCTPHGLSLGSVKGQVFDKKGKVIVGAKVRIKINDYDWQSDANPARTNADGWYEWILQVGQRIKFVELIVDGRSVPFSPRDFEVTSIGGCFQHVDFVEQ